ncbi:uncharacterized protein LOC119463835 [Dermacentor silvarum]|uniref:uncharacterized protein LOC119463835 n=1 Tax=Dermacentor silvarum TaxID=543639 RepID=UPI00189B0216|nr:uncharacterized protein LOC119463835 [Dermacentor silvarum]
MLVSDLDIRMYANTFVVYCAGMHRSSMNLCDVILDRWSWDSPKITSSSNWKLLGRVTLKPPEGTSLADDDGLLLVANQRSLVCAARSAFPREARISKALFCGCTSFESSRHYASAASELLRDTQEIYIVHNRDKVYKLIRMFPNAKVLALPHDLCTHALELDEPRRDRSAPLVDRSQLRELVGSMRSLSEGCMRLSRETTLAVMLTCPQLRRIDSRWVANCFMELHGLPSSIELPMPTNFTHLCLYSKEYMTSGGKQSPSDGS